MYIYEGHMGSLYTSGEPLEYEDLYCEQCGDRDWELGCASNREEAWKLLMPETNVDGLGGWDYEYVKEFIEKNWEA